MINNFSTDKFLSQHWQKSPCLIKNAFLEPINYLSSNDLASLSLNDEVEARIVRNDDNKWQLLNGPFNEETFRKLPESHWTLLVQTVDFWLPEVYELIANFDFIPRWRFDDLMISYATAEGGVGPHYDNYDVFLIQTEGQRRWRVGYKGDIENQQTIINGLKHLAPFKTQIDIVMEPGDMLYIPPETPHWGISIGESMGYSIGYRSLQSKNVVALLAEHFESVVSSNFFTDEYRNQINNGHQIEPELIQWAQSELKSVIENKDLLYQLLSQSLSHSKIDPPELKQISSKVEINQIESIQLLQSLNRNYFETNDNIILNIEGDSFLFCKREHKFVTSITKGKNITLKTIQKQLTSVEFSETLTSMVNRGYFNYHLY